MNATGTTSAVVKMKNGTHWAYKPGCMLVSTYEGPTKNFLEEVCIQTGPVEAQQEFSLTIPLKLKGSADLGSHLGSIDADFFLVNPKGKYFGEKITLKVQIPVGEAEFYQRALHLKETVGSSQFNFQDIQAVLRQADNDVELAKALLESMKITDTDMKETEK